MTEWSRRFSLLGLVILFACTVSTGLVAQVACIEEDDAFNSLLRQHLLRTILLRLD